MTTRGERDPQSVLPGGTRAVPPRIEGVQIFELGNVITRSGWMVEVFRADWPVGDVAVQQINYVSLAPNGVTDWHRHLSQVDRLLAVGGVIKLALWDDREDSPTRHRSEVIRMGAVRPVLVVVPRGVWHALRNDSGEPAGYLNIIDALYDHAHPDNWRLAHDTADIPAIL